MEHVPLQPDWSAWASLHDRHLTAHGVQDMRHVGAAEDRAIDPLPRVGVHAWIRMEPQVQARAPTLVAEDHLLHLVDLAMEFIVNKVRDQRDLALKRLDGGGESIACLVHGVPLCERCSPASFGALVVVGFRPELVMRERQWIAVGIVAAVAAIGARPPGGARGSGARGPTLPMHLRFLTRYLGAPHEGLAAYFPETARGALRPGRGEQWFSADGLSYLGDSDGTMVPILAENLEPMPQNIFDAAKLSALVEAIEEGKEPGVQPGYADLTVEDGALVAQVRDGNHRTFAPILAGGDMSWVMLSDNVRQDLDRHAPGTEALYRAIRAAQRAAGAPLFQRRANKAKGTSVDLQRMVELEVRLDDLRRAEEDAYRKILRHVGPLNATAWSIQDQEERPQIFCRMRLQQLVKEWGKSWLEANILSSPGYISARKTIEGAVAERIGLVEEVYELRKKLGIRPGERLDPKTRKIVLN